MQVTWDPSVLASPSAQSKLVAGQADAARTALLSGSIDGAMSTVTGLGALLNAAGGSAGGASGRRHLLQSGAGPDAAARARSAQRESLLGIMSDAAIISVPSPQSLAQISQAVASVVSTPGELTAAAQAATVSILTSVALGGSVVTSTSAKATGAGLDSVVTAAQAATTPAGRRHLRMLEWLPSPAALPRAKPQSPLAPPPPPIMAPRAAPSIAAQQLNRQHAHAAASPPMAPPPPPPSIATPTPAAFAYTDADAKQLPPPPPSMPPSMQQRRVLGLAAVAPPIAPPSRALARSMPRMRAPAVRPLRSLLPAALPPTPAALLPASSTLHAVVNAVAARAGSLHDGMSVPGEDPASVITDSIKLVAQLDSPTGGAGSRLFSQPLTAPGSLSSFAPLPADALAGATGAVRTQFVALGFKCAPPFTQVKRSKHRRVALRAILFPASHANALLYFFGAGGRGPSPKHSHRSARLLHQLANARASERCSLSAAIGTRPAGRAATARRRRRRSRGCRLETAMAAKSLSRG